MAATNMTIKRYNGTSWVDYAPATTIAQVSGLETALNGKQATLTFDSAPTENSSNPVTSGGVYTSIANVQAVANGKTKTYVTNKTKASVFNSSNNQVSTSQSITLSDNTTVALSSLKVGDVFLLTDTDLPDRWVSGVVESSGNYMAYFDKLETTKVDLSGYVPTSRTINGKALTTDITLGASDVSALPSDTSYLASASANGNTLTITPSSGTAITYTPTIPTNYLSDTPTSSTSKTYLIGKSGTGASSTNNYNSNVYMTDGKLYATSFEATNALYLSSNSSPSADGLSNVSNALYWKTTKVVTGNYIKSASSSNNVLTLTIQDDSTQTFTNNTSYIGSSTPSNAHSGDIWFVTA